MPLLIIALIGLSGSMFTLGFNSGYKSGQYDALNGKLKYELTNTREVQRIKKKQEVK